MIELGVFSFKNGIFSK